MYAARNGKLDCLDLLIARGANLEATGPVRAALPRALRSHVRINRVELAILFHSETASPTVSWSRLALRITRTRRSRRKSLHRTSSSRFPSNSVVVGRLGATIGRSPKCDIFVDDLTAANFHAQVFVAGQSLVGGFCIFSGACVLTRHCVAALAQVVYVQDGYVLQTIADPDFFGTFILLGRKSAPSDRYRHESKGLYVVWGDCFARVVWLSLGY